MSAIQIPKVAPRIHECSHPPLNRVAGGPFTRSTPGSGGPFTRSTPGSGGPFTPEHLGREWGNNIRPNLIPYPLSLTLTPNP
jgi:hypothetical protein